MSTEVAQNKEIVRRLYEDCVNGRKFELLDDLIADEYVRAGGLGAGNLKGPAAFRSTIDELHGAFPDIHYTLEDMIGEGDRVLLRWTWRGTHNGPFRKFPPTGKTITNTGMGIHQIRAGKVVKVWLETDRLGFLEQMGAVTAGLAGGPPPTPRP